MQTISVNVNLSSDEEEATHYYVIFDQDKAGVFTERPPNTSIGRWPYVYPLVIVCTCKNDLRMAWALHEQVFFYLPNTTVAEVSQTILDRAHASPAALSLFAGANIYSFRVSKANGIYGRCDWYSFMEPRRGAENSGHQIRRCPLFIEALEHYLNRAHLGASLGICTAFVAPSQPTPSQPSSPTKRVGSRSSSPSKPPPLSSAEWRPMPSMSTMKSVSFSLPPPSSPTKASSLSTSQPPLSPTKASSSSMSRPPSSPTKGLSPSVSSTRASSRGLSFAAGSSVVAPISTNVQSHGNTSSSRAAGASSLSSALSNVHLGGDSDPDDDAVFHDAPDTVLQAADALRHIIRHPSRTMNRPDRLPVVNLGERADVWFTSRNYGPAEQLVLLQHYLWAEDMNTFVTSIGQSSLDLRVWEAQYVYDLIPTLLAP